MKQIELANLLGISKSYLSMILSGQRRCPPELGDKLSSLKVVNFEASSSLRGRCPKPLDECTTQNYGWALRNHIELFATRFDSQIA
jgi:transcriptional regulator with XRE-family HTH domain